MNYYVGIDLHRDFFIACGQDETGTVLFTKRFINDQRSVKDLVSEFPLPPEVAVEATRNWIWLVSELQQQGCQTILAHPFKTKAIASARIKTDSLDAKTLGDLLRAEPPPCLLYRFSPRTRQSGTGKGQNLPGP